MNILILNGPNINLLGQREPQHYGSLTLDQINAKLTDLADELGLTLTFKQSNYEGALVEAVQEAADDCAGVVLNAAGYTHTSVALRDAVLACPLPVVEVHLSNPAARDSFRHRSYLAGACVGSVAGFGWRSYALALYWFAQTQAEA